jgi:hypothetical protein
VADFCMDCTADLWGDQQGRNDLVHDGGESWWALCEGCGVHAFDPAGRRRCARTQDEFHRTDGESEWMPTWPDPCEECGRLEVARTVDSA